MISLGYLTVDGRTQKAEIPAVRAAFPLGPRGWDGPHGWVALVLLVPPDGNLGRGDLDLDPALRVRIRREPVPHRHHRGRDERRFRPRVIPVGWRMRPSRAAQAVPPHRISWVWNRPARDGSEPDDVRILSGKPDRRIPGRGERSRGDRTAHGDIEARGLARAPRDHEPDDGDGLGRGLGARHPLAGGRPGFGRRWPGVDAVPVRDWSRPGVLCRRRRPIRDPGGCGPRGPEGRPSGRCTPAGRARAFPPDANRPFRRNPNGLRREPPPAISPGVLVVRAPPLRRLHRLLQLLPDLPLASVRVREPGDFRDLYRESGHVDRGVPARRRLGLLTWEPADAAVWKRRAVRPLQFVLPSGDRGTRRPPASRAHRRAPRGRWCMLGHD